MKKLKRRMNLNNTLVESSNAENVITLLEVVEISKLTKEMFMENKTVSY